MAKAIRERRRRLRCGREEVVKREKREMEGPAGRLARDDKVRVTACGGCCCCCFPLSSLHKYCSYYLLTTVHRGLTTLRYSPPLLGRLLFTFPPPAPQLAWAPPPPTPPLPPSLPPFPPLPLPILVARLARPPSASLPLFVVGFVYLLPLVTPLLLSNSPSPTLPYTTLVTYTACASLRAHAHHALSAHLGSLSYYHM